MPKIRKKTSNRASTNDRAKLRHKVSEGRKKKRKLGKKNPQWKSRVPKDPGIPNSMPFKDQVLAEVAEERRRTEEERLAKRELAKQKKASNAIKSHAERDSDDDTPVPGVTSIPSARKTIAAPSLKRKRAPETLDVQKDEAEDEPLLLDPSIPDLGLALDAADVWVHILDSRDPALHRSAFIEELSVTKRKPLVFILSKIDLAPKEAIQAWLAHLQTYSCLPFRSSSFHLPTAPEYLIKQQNVKDKTDAVGVSSILDKLRSFPASSSSGALTVAVIGHSNSGKSSFINSICHSSRLPIFDSEIPMKAGDANVTTLRAQPITFTGSSGIPIRFIDTPGFETSRASDNSGAESEDREETDTLVRNRGRLEKMKRPIDAARIVIARAIPEDLILQYNTPSFLTSDPEAFLSGHARSTGRLKRGGVLDVQDSARSLLRDWRVPGKFGYYTMPPSNEKGSSVTSSLSPEVDAVLRSRKEIRNTPGAGGLVRLRVDAKMLPDTRAILMTAPVVLSGKATLTSETKTIDAGEVASEGEDEDDEEDEDEDEISGDSDEESSDEIDETDSASDEPPPPPRKKSTIVQKMKTTTLKDKSPVQVTKAKKTVSFAAKGKPSTTSTTAAIRTKSDHRESSTPKAKAVKTTVEVTAEKGKRTTSGTLKSAIKVPGQKSQALKVGNSAGKPLLASSKVGTTSKGAGDDTYDFKQYF